MQLLRILSTPHAGIPAELAATERDGFDAVYDMDKKYVEWTNLLFHPNIMSTLIRAAAKRSVQALQLISLRQLWVK